MKLSLNLALLGLTSVTAFTLSPTNGRSTAQTSLEAVSGRRGFLESAMAAGILLVPQAAMAEPRPMYLTEPTEEFKINEAKAMEFKRQQLQVKREFVAALEKLVSEPNDSAALVGDLKNLKQLVAQTGGLPLGIKKEDLFKQIRSKKAKGFWPTEVEVAYQSLIAEISFQQSPNLDKESGNPYQ